MDFVLSSVTPSVANNSLPPPPRDHRRKNNFPKSSSAVKSEKQQSLAHRDPKLSIGARLPHPSDSSRRPSAPATYHSGPFPAGSNKEDGTLDGELQLNKVSPMLFRGSSAQARMERPSQPTPSEGYSDALCPSSTKMAYYNIPSSQSSLERSNELVTNPTYAPLAFLDRQRNNSSVSSFHTARDSPTPKDPPIPALQSFTSSAPQSRPAKANKILGIGAPNAVSPQSRTMEHRPPRRAYDDDEHVVQWSRNSKANKLLGIAPDQGTTFDPPPRSHSSSLFGHTTTRGAPDLGRVHSNSSSRTRAGSSSSSQGIEDLGRGRRESFMDFSPLIPSHQKSKSQPEALSRPPDSASSFRTIFSTMSTDSGFPAFSKRRPESIGQSQPNTTLKAFKELVKKVDGKMKDGQAEDGWERIDAKEADFNNWGWDVPSSVQERRHSEWAEAYTLPDEDREDQTTPKLTTMGLSPAPSASVNMLDQKERLAVIRRKRKITQLLGTDIPPYTLGPVVQDRTSMEHKESWEPLNNQGTIYLDVEGNVREGARFSDSSGSFVSEHTELSSLVSSSLASNDRLKEFGRGKDKDMRGADSPTSFMELSDEESGSHKGKVQKTEYSRLPQQFSETPIVEPPPTKVAIKTSSSSPGRTFSTFTTSDLSFSQPGDKTLKHKPSFITEILEDSDWEAHERKKKRDKLAKMHRFLGSRVPAELVLGYSSGTIPPAALLYEDDEEDTGKGRGKGRKHSPNVGWKDEREMRNLGAMGGTDKMAQVRRMQKIEKMFGEQPPSALLRPYTSLQASSTPPPSSSSQPRSTRAPSSHSASRSGVPRVTSGGPTPFTANVTHNINLLYGDLPSDSNDKKHKDKRKDKFVPTLSTTNSDSLSAASPAGSMSGLINDFKVQECRWKGKTRLAAPPEGVVLDITSTDDLSTPWHRESSYASRRQPPLSKGRHSSQFVHYRKSFKSLATIVDMGDKASLEELYAMLNTTSPAGSDTEAELAHTKHIHDISGYDSDPASPTSSLIRRRSRLSRMSMMSMSSASSGTSLFTVTPEPMGFQARRKRAAKLTNFFGASYRDLFGEVLQKLEVGFLEEAKEGGMSREEVADLMGQVKTLRGRRTDIW